MKFKDGVEYDRLHPDILEILPEIEAEYRYLLESVGLVSPVMTMTSGHEETSKHGKKSKHYIRNCVSGRGEAADFRMNDIPQTLATEVCGRIAKHLREERPDKFKVFFEGCLTSNAHLHIQLV